MSPLLSVCNDNKKNVVVGNVNRKQKNNNGTCVKISALCMCATSNLTHLALAIPFIAMLITSHASSFELKFFLFQQPSERNKTNKKKT